jgi:hypothetical protein
MALRAAAIPFSGDVIREPLAEDKALALREALHAFENPLGVGIPFYEDEWCVVGGWFHVLGKFFHPPAAAEFVAASL